MTDFKQALAALDAEIEKAIGAGFPMHDDHYAQTIRKALQIADALMKEPSEAMLYRINRAFDFHFEDNRSTIFAFKTMRDELIKEIL